MDELSFSPAVFRLARAMRFALVSIVLCLAYFTIRASLSIGDYEQIFKDMLGGKPLPAVTVFVINARYALMACSFIFPLVAVAMLFNRRLIASFYLLGILSLLVVAQFILVFQGVAAPLYQIIAAIEGGQ